MGRSESEEKNREAAVARSNFGIRRVLGSLLGALILILTLSAAASADLIFCPPGSAAGECTGQTGLATDFEDELLYVADTSNNRVGVFEADGSFTMAFGWDVVASGP